MGREGAEWWMIVWTGQGIGCGHVSRAGRG
jgi:hypothetical protein